MTQAPPPALEARGIKKRFGAQWALDGVDFTLLPGEIHALLGENGAGKSTLMNILRGLLAPTQGQILLGGSPIVFRSPDEAAQLGIGMVHQHFLLVPSFTVADNLALAAKSLPRSWNLDTRALIAQAESLANRLGWAIPMNARLSDLPVGTQQRIEILKALLGNARILLFDEPTAVLAPNEIEELFAVLRTLRAEGRSLVFVSHKLNEVMALCDRVTVLRRGSLVGSVAVADTSPEDLARRMVGNQLENEATAHGSVTEAAPLLTVTGLATKPETDAVALHEITFALRPGEILGFAGVDGNGQTELAEALTGLRPWTDGKIALEGNALQSLSPQALERRSIGFIPPDRHREGLALSLSVAENLMLEAARLPEFRQGVFLNRRKLRDWAAQTAQEFDVRAADLSAPAASLSGGNQQKIVIARALWRKPKLLIAVSPTRGLDVAATGYVHSRLRRRRDEGGAIVLISTELDEVVALSDRIAVLYEGRIIGIVPPNTPRETLGLMMGGRAHA